MPTPQTAKEVIEAFEEDYFSVRLRTGKSETTWKTDYKEVLKRLNPEVPITEEALLSLILATEPDTKARQRTCLACGARPTAQACALRAVPQSSYEIRLYSICRGKTRMNHGKKTNLSRVLITEAN